MMTFHPTKDVMKSGAHVPKHRGLHLHHTPHHPYLPLITMHGKQSTITGAAAIPPPRWMTHTAQILRI